MGRPWRSLLLKSVAVSEKFRVLQGGVGDKCFQSGRYCVCVHVCARVHVCLNFKAPNFASVTPV